MFADRASLLHILSRENWRPSVTKGDKKVIEVLNRALRHELTAVSQYWLHYRLLENWGFKKLADRIIQLDGHPNFQTLDSLQIGQSLKEVLESDLKGEQSARKLYLEASKISNEAEDYVSQKLFESLLADEEGHIDHLETELALIERIGVENYGLLRAGGEAKE